MRETRYSELMLAVAGAYTDQACSGAAMFDQL